MIGDKIENFVRSVNAVEFVKVDHDALYDLECLLRMRDWAMDQLLVSVGDRVQLKSTYFPEGDFKRTLMPGLEGTVEEIYLTPDKQWRISFRADFDDRVYATIPLRDFVLVKV